MKTAVNSKLVKHFSKSNGFESLDKILSPSDGSTLARISADGKSLVGAGGVPVEIVNNVTNPCLEYGQHLTRFAAAISQSIYTRVGVTVVGNSITEGYYANDAITNNFPIFEQRGYVGQLRDRFAQTHGLVGIGAVLCTDNRCVAAGGATIYGSIGISSAGGCRINNTGQTFTLTLTEPATEVWVHGWWESDAKCAAFKYSVDGGADQSASISSLGTDADYTFKITGLSASTHTVVIKPAATATKQIDIAGFSVFSSSQAGGVVVNRLGQGGGYIDTVLYPMSDTGAQPRSSRLTFGRTGTDLAVLAFGANESSVTGESVGWTPARYRESLLDAVTYLTDVRGCSVLLASLVRQNPAQVGSYGEEAFYDVHREIAAANPNVAHFDLKRSEGWSSYANASAKRLIDNVHPNLYGHSDVGRILHACLMSAI